MPTSFLGLALFAAILTPGFAYLTTRERLLAVRQLSALRETASITTVSLACDATALAFFGAVRALRPEWTPDVGRLVREGSAYAETEYVALILWGGALLAVASAIGATAGNIAGRRVSGNARRIEWVSGWTKAFSVNPGTYRQVYCELTDDSAIMGTLWSFTPQLEETQDRALVLSPPLFIRRTKDGSLERWRTGSVVIGAGQIRHLSVGYLDNEPSEAIPGQGVACDTAVLEPVAEAHAAEEPEEPTDDQAHVEPGVGGE